MKRIEANITVYMDQLKGNVEALRKAEAASVQEWKQQGILEHLYIRESGEGAVLIFKNIERSVAEAMIRTLPLFPQFEKVEYTAMEKVF